MRRLPLVCCVALFLASWYTCRRLFSTEYLPYMHSIEGAYIALTRYTMEHWGDLWWFPLWHSGMPFQNAYQPGLHLLAAAAGSFFGWSAGIAYHFTVALFYCLGPVFLFWMSWRMTGALGASAAAGLIYALFSPSALLMSIVLRDLESIWHARRYMTLVYYGEGPNVSGLTLVPLAFLGIHAVCRRGPEWIWLPAALVLGATVLVSWPAGVVVTLGALAYLLAQDMKAALRRIPALLLLAGVAYALISPWNPPSTVRVNQTNAQLIGEYPWTPWHVLYWAAAIGTAFLIRWFLRRIGVHWFLQFSLLFTWITGLVTLAADWRGLHLLPQPERFHLAMEMGIALSLAFGIKPLVDRWPRLRWAVAACLVLFAAHQLVTYRLYNRGITQRFDISNAVEYRLARWLDANLASDRVFVPGSIAFWMNTWTDTPQVTGCCLPGLPNWMNAVASYIITSDDGAQGREAGVSLLWLKAFGAHAVATGGPDTKEHYRDFINPYKYEGKLALLWREGDDRLYRVPQRSQSLARVVRRDQIVADPPVNGMDIAAIERYVAGLDDASLPLASLEWKSSRRMRIAGTLRPEHVVSLQITHHPGWRASANGRDIPIHPDGLGLMFLEPRCSGSCEIDMYYDGGREMYACRVASGLSLAGLLGAVVIAMRRELRVVA